MSSHYTKHYYIESDRFVSKIGGGYSIGVIFDYAKSGHNTYIHNKNTRQRDNARMNTSSFLKPFVTPTGKKL